MKLERNSFIDAIKNSKKYQHESFGLMTLLAYLKGAAEESKDTELLEIIKSFEIMKVEE